MEQPEAMIRYANASLSSDMGSSVASEKRVPAAVILEDGRRFDGYSFGYEADVSAEVVFTTAMVGYPESLTDPSYCGQLLCLTFPLIGNYGVAPLDEKDEYGLLKHFEGDRIFIAGLIVADYSFVASHHEARLTLADWLKQEKIPGIFGVDTRALTKHIRSKGAMAGKIVILDSKREETALRLTVPPLSSFPPRNLVAEVAKSEIRRFKTPIRTLTRADLDSTDGSQVFNILAVDCGMKNNIIRQFLEQTEVNLSLTIVPWDFPFGEKHGTFDPLDYDGFFISNGPGDPEHCVPTIENLRKLFLLKKPIFGICLGNQLMALAAGAKTYKMKYGNRGMNQPVIDLRTGRCYITPQNHGFAVDRKSLPTGWTEVFINANDRSNEGIAHQTLPYMAVQFHPEACGGPTDTWFLFQQFLFRVSSDNRSPPLTVLPVSIPCQREKVLILGSGGLHIGQAGEFDYSGSQAIKALKECNVQVILINPNIATVQTSGHLADRVYFLPVEAMFVERVIAREKPQGLLCSFGGQTALNCAIELHRSGVLKRSKCRVLGTDINTIIATEDRQLFADKLKEIGEACAPSGSAHNLEGCRRIAREIGFPVLIRAAFALGGLGSGLARNEKELDKICAVTLQHSAQVLLDKAFTGWKEIEYEVVRDCKDNCIAVCNMENLDPLGIHTGDSIVVAPSQTLTNYDFFRLREVALKVIRHLRIVGECNIQYAVDPDSSRYYIVEVNARLSRSSALASKATGYPLAYVAAKLALGVDLLQIRNAVTRETAACAEPALDYIVTKVPRWDLAKFAYVDQSMGSSMKSVGEVMAIGRTFEESLQKALRMVDENCGGFEWSHYFKTDVDVIRRELQQPSPLRIWAIGRAFERGISVDEVFHLTRIDRWFLAKLFRIFSMDQLTRQLSLAQITPAFFSDLKKAGFADRQIARLVTPVSTESEVRQRRRELGLRPWIKQIDTTAAEFPACTNYLYMTYNGSEHDVEPLSLETIKFAESALSQSTGGGPVIVLGCGCYRIGSSVEFDWSAMSCVRTLRSLSRKAIVINCNPETVSTDYDESDRLYFETLDAETVLELYDFEKPSGVVVSVGGQTPNNMAIELDACDVRILGTSAKSIDTAENRHLFSALCDRLGVDQPAWSAFSSLDSAKTWASDVGYPVLVRPSYVLSGAAMRVVCNAAELQRFLSRAAHVSPDHPVVISKYVDNAKEVEMDAVANEGHILNYAISEHVEDAGVHSGDATLLLPAQKLYVETIRQVRKISQKIAKALNISGPFNVQFMCKKNRVQVIECNLRASRTFPFISKTFNTDFIALATRVFIGAPARARPLQLTDVEHVGVKVPVFSFTRLRGADPMLGVEMRSTGEVACFGVDKYEAMLKASIASGFKLPPRFNTNSTHEGFINPASTKPAVLVSIGTLESKIQFLHLAKLLASKLGFLIYATPGTYDFLVEYERSVTDDKYDDVENRGMRWLVSTPSSTSERSLATPQSPGTGVMPTPIGTENLSPVASQESLAEYSEQENKRTSVDHMFRTSSDVADGGNLIFMDCLKRAEKYPNPGYPDQVCAVDLIEKKEVHMVINISGSFGTRSSGTAGYRIRRAAVNTSVPLITDLKAGAMIIEGLVKMYETEAAGEEFWQICSWDEYVKPLL